MNMYEKIAQMKPEQKNHWFEIPELSYWGERFFAEFAVAEALAHPEERIILEDAINGLYDAFLSEHALTDTACREAEDKLLPFSQRAKAFNLHCVAHAHIDMDWMWGLHETVDISLSTFRTMLDLMDEYPEFTFSQSQCAVYRMSEFYDPSLFRKMKKRIEEGRFEFAGSTWVELDKNMPNLESMARHILYTKQFLNKKFGIPFTDVNLDFHPDTFGHSADIPQILRAGGIRYFYHCRGLDGEYFYRWQGKSGAEVLALNEPLWYNDSIRPMYLSQVPKVCRRYGIRDMMKIYGVGDHGGGPTRKDIERILDMKTWPIAPTVFFSTYKRYFESIAPYQDHFPILIGELGPTFTGCYTSQSQIKQANRIGEDRLFMAEGLAAFAARDAGMEPFTEQFRVAWERILFNQFHDILPGSNTPDSKVHAVGAFEEAMGAAVAASGAALRALADAIDTSAFETPRDAITSTSEGSGVGMSTNQRNRFKLPSVERGVGKTRLIHFFNPTGFDREEILECSIWDWPGDADYIQAFDVRNEPLSISAVTSANLDWGHTRTDILVSARVPAMGYTTIRITEGKRTGFSFCELPPDPRVTYFHPLIMENDLIRVEFEESDLSIKRYISKATGEDLLGPEGGKFILYRERNTPSGGCGWREGIHMEPKDLHRCGTVRLKTEVKTGLLRQTMEYTIDYQGSQLNVLARLDKNSPILELDVTAKWMHKADETGSPKLCFRLDLKDTPNAFLSDSQIGIQIRKPEPLHDWCSRNFYHETKGGMTILTDTKYGYRGYDQKLEVSLLRSSSRPDPLPEIGERVFRIGIAQSATEAMALKKLASRFAHRDLPYVSNRSHKGHLPPENRLLNVTGPCVVSALKSAENGTGWVLRLAAQGGPEEVRIQCTQPFSAEQIDLAEQRICTYPVRNGTITVQTDEPTIYSFLLVFD